MTTTAVGLTGGIGAGKSLVAELLVERGAVVIDADAIARQALGPHGSARQGVIDRFGTEILGLDGEIDRSALAAIVFDTPQARADLNSITHPGIRRAMWERLALEQDRATPLVILEIPLLVEGGRKLWPIDGVIVVDAPVEVAVSRLVERRGMSMAQARARVAAQADRGERLAVADFVVDNSADLEHLDAEVGRAWDWIGQLEPRGSRASPVAEKTQG